MSRKLVSVAASFLMAACSSSVRLDGSSEETFVSSHQRLLASLAPEERLKLTLAEAVVLSRMPCSQTKEPIPDMPALTQATGGYTSIKACRRELNGMSYQDIVERSQRVGEQGERGTLQSGVEITVILRRKLPELRFAGYFHA